MCPKAESPVCARHTPEERPIRYRFICPGTDERRCNPCVAVLHLGAAGRAKAMPTLIVSLRLQKPECADYCHTGRAGEKRIRGASQDRSATARGGVAGFSSRKRPVTRAYVFVRPPLQKILPPKIFGFVFLNLTTREACGIAANHWAEPRSARGKIGKIETSLILECILNSARTYYQSEC